MTLALSLTLLTRVLLLLCGTEDCLKEAYRQLNDKELYEQVPNDPSGLANTLMKALEKICLQVDLLKDTLVIF